MADQLRYAKYPMIKRIENLDLSIPIWFIYGKKTWIDKEAGEIVKNMRDGNAYVSVKVNFLSWLLKLIQMYTHDLYLLCLDDSRCWSPCLCRSTTEF